MILFNYGYPIYLIESLSKTWFKVSFCIGIKLTTLPCFTTVVFCFLEIKHNNFSYEGNLYQFPPDYFTSYCKYLSIVKAIVLKLITGEFPVTFFENKLCLFAYAKNCMLPGLKNFKHNQTSNFLKLKTQFYAKVHSAKK